MYSCFYLIKFTIVLITPITSPVCNHDAHDVCERIPREIDSNPPFFEKLCYSRIFVVFVSKQIHHNTLSNYYFPKKDQWIWRNKREWYFLWLGHSVWPPSWIPCLLKHTFTCFYLRFFMFKSSSHSRNTHRRQHIICFITYSTIICVLWAVGDFWSFVSLSTAPWKIIMFLEILILKCALWIYVAESTHTTAPANRELALLVWQLIIQLILDEEVISNSLSYLNSVLILGPNIQSKLKLILGPSYSFAEFISLT